MAASPASARMGPMPAGPASTRSRRAWGASCRLPAIPGKARCGAASRSTTLRPASNAHHAEIIRQHPTAYWVERLNKAGVPCGPINSIDQTFADPQVQHLGIAKPVAHPKLGPQKVVGQPIHMSGYPQPDELRLTPDQGEHTEAVPRELGYDAETIAGLHNRGVV